MLGISFKRCMSKPLSASSGPPHPISELNSPNYVKIAASSMYPVFLACMAMLVKPITPPLNRQSSVLLKRLPKSGVRSPFAPSECYSYRYFDIPGQLVYFTSSQHSCFWSYRDKVCAMGYLGYISIVLTPTG